MSKKSFVLRINPETLKLLDKWASDEFRSLNGQIEYLLQRALIDAGRWKKPSEKIPDNQEESTKKE
ncbi:MAG: hypothetical protein J5I59_04120 [Saprospiraceae bacterium]|nr:hypothetical protein [Saprospiraceae bacterium]